VVRIRLSRVGRKKTPIYRIVVADSRSPRDGKVIESIGRYDPREEPSLIEVDESKARDWLAKGAQPSQTVSKLLAVKGIS
jgi:small subunit ribosomal protein S16